MAVAAGVMTPARVLAPPSSTRAGDLGTTDRGGAVGSVLTLYLVQNAALNTSVGRVAAARAAILSPTARLIVPVAGIRTLNSTMMEPGVTLSTEMLATGAPVCAASSSHASCLKLASSAGELSTSE